MKIYVDILIVTNFIMTLVYLETFSKIIHKEISPPRLFSASLIGGIFSLILIANANTFASAVVITIIKGVGILLTLIVGCRFNGISQLIRYLIIYIAVRIVYTGITLIYWEISDTKRIFVRNYTVYFDISPVLLILAVISAYGVLTLFEIISRKRLDGVLRYEAVYRSGNYEVRLPAVADSGNRLCDPFTGMPAVIFCSGEMYRHFGLDSYGENNLSGFRLIPYSTVDGEGLIPVTSKGTVTVIDEEKREFQVKCCVGIINPQGKKSRAIFNPILLK